MNKIMNAVIGDPKNASPAKKYAAYALLGTAVAFVLALVILIGSSIAFAVADGKSQDQIINNDPLGEGGDVSSSKGNITYTTVTADELDANVGSIISIADIRSKLNTGDADYYYAKNDKDGVDKLAKDAAEALDDMLVAFYNANKAALVTDTENNSCNIPLIMNTGSEGYTFDIVVFHNDKSIADTEFKSTYQWIFTNAHTYGFIYTNNSFRYVGPAAANYMKLNAKSISSYDALINVLKTNTKGNISTTVSDGSTKVSYQLYYLSADASELKVPTNYEYSVIADGTNGYIITVNMSKPVTAQDTDIGVG